MNPPLRCFSSVGGDDFAGWFAITNPSVCNDFCFWSTNETFDPHQTTFIAEKNSSWLCAYRAYSDNRGWDDVLFESIAYNKSTFEHLRCSRGPGEIITSNAQNILYSKRFWISLLATVVSILVFEVFLFIFCICRKKHSRSISYEQPCQTHESPRRVGVMVKTCREKCRRCTWCMLLITNILLYFVMSLASISLSELLAPYDFTAIDLQRITPSCVSHFKVCSQGNDDIDRESTAYNDTAYAPFSYIVASDVQLNWYDGEFPMTATWPIPLPCSQNDSCSTCTRKVSEYTNGQMKKAMECLTSATMNSSSSWVVPQTLVMNGDLTSYFHRSEEKSFDLFYHHIENIHQYFPSLGNHDYDHMEGASFDGDEWLSPRNCNAVHAVGYLKSAFCKKVPKFDAINRLTRYDSKSLAYSWEEMNYHFVHLHYYPSYENARLQISSSLQWLERDLSLAAKKNLTSVLFVHAVEGIPSMMKNILVDKNVAAIFGGHQHKCIGRKCEILSPVKELEVNSYYDIQQNVQQCFPAGATLCGGYADSHSMSLFYVTDALKLNPHLRTTKLFVPEFVSLDSCPGPISKTFINHTDNTLLCRRVEIYKPSYDIGRKNQSIPIFWSGSATFQTFLKVDFYLEKLVVHVHTAEAGHEGELYTDTHQLPNIIYPYHDVKDLQSVTIKLN